VKKTHNQAEETSNITDAVTTERERCANIALSVGYAFCKVAERNQFYEDGHTEYDRVIEVTEAIAKAISSS